MGEIVLRDDKATARLFIKPMNDAAPHFAANSRETGRVREQRINQCAGTVTRARMHRNARRFVQHDQIVIFMEDGQRHSCSRRGSWLRVGFLPQRRHRDAISPFYDVARPRRVSIQQNSAVANQRLYSHARNVRNFAREKLIQPQARVLGLDDKFAQSRQWRVHWRRKIANATIAENG